MKVRGGNPFQKGCTIDRSGYSIDRFEFEHICWDPKEIFNRGKKILDKHPPVLLVHPGGKPLSKDSQDSVRVLPLESGWKALAWPQSIKTGSQGAKLEIRLVLEGHSPAVKAP